MKLTKEQIEKCKKIFMQLGEDALYKSHYDLAAETTIKDPQIWKSFLIEPSIADYIASEMNLIRTATMNRMIANAGDSNSVGQSQLLNTLNKIDEKEQIKSGPTFIYCYVPLNNKQKHAPNVRIANAEGLEKIGDNEYELEI